MSSPSSKKTLAQAVARTASPVKQVAPEGERLSFAQAIAEVVAGKKIARAAWYEMGRLATVYRKNGSLLVHWDGYETAHAYLITDPDLDATDWLVVGSTLN